MAADLNRVTLVGRLTRDPEQRGNGAVTTFRLAVTSRDKQGDEWVDVSNYFDVVCFGRTGETVFSYCTKGRRVGVDGSMRWREWEDKDGNKRQTVEVRAQDVFFLDSAGDRPAKSDLPVDTTGLSRKQDDEVPF